MCRLVRSVNAALGLQTFNIVILSGNHDLQKQLEKDFQIQHAFYHDRSVTNNGKCCGISPCCVVTLLSTYNYTCINIP